MNSGFEAMLKRIDQRFDAVTIQPARSTGPPRRSFGPRRNVQDVTCYACGQKGHYARDCKGATFSSLPPVKQQEIAGALDHAPVGDFTMAMVWEQFAPDNSQSLDESLTNLHNWTTSTPLSPALVHVLANQHGLTVTSQVDSHPAPSPSSTPLGEVPPTLHPPSPTRIDPFAEPPLRAPLSPYLSNEISGVRTPRSLRRGGTIKLPAVPEGSCPRLTVHGSTLKAPSCGGKSRGCGISGRLLIARPERHGGYTEPSIQPPMSWESSGLPGWLRKSSCFRPVAGESNKNENKTPSRTFWSSAEEKTPCQRRSEK